MSLFGQKKKKNEWSAIVLVRGVVYFFLCVEGNGKQQESDTEVVPVKIMTHVSHYTALFTFTQVRKWVSRTVHTIGW